MPFANQNFYISKLFTMKKILLLSLSLSYALFSFAGPEDSTATTKKKPKPLAKERVFLAYDFNFLVNSGSGIEVSPFRSGGVTTALFWDRPFGRSPISLAIGVGFSSFNIHSRSAIGTDAIGSNFFFKLPDSVSISRNKISLNYLELPLELRFRTRPNTKNQSFKIALGFKAGYLIQSHTKYKGDDLATPIDDKIKVKTFNIDNMSPWRYGVTARIGYGMFNLYGFYSLQGLFNEPKVSKGQPNPQGLTIGIAITPY
jgi:hypothetical protein